MVGLRTAALLASVTLSCIAAFPASTALAHEATVFAGWVESPVASCPGECPLFLAALVTFQAEREAVVAGQPAACGWLHAEVHGVESGWSTDVDACRVRALDGAFRLAGPQVTIDGREIVCAPGAAGALATGRFATEAGTWVAQLTGSCS